ERFQGDLAPDLKGVGSRLTQAQIRARIIDPTKANPDTIMPAYYKTEGLARVAGAYRGKPILSAEQIDDVVAYLASLKCALNDEPRPVPGPHRRLRRASRDGSGPTRPQSRGE